MDLIEELDENELFAEGENLDQSNEPIEAHQGEIQSDDQDEKEPVIPKKIVRRPRPKLNAELLKGRKGLGNLEKCFERVQFEGNGHEEQNLNVLLKTYEYWCHRLFPKFPFKDCVSKIEKLGSNASIQTYLKKVRSGLVDDDTESPDVLPDFRSDEEDEVEPSSVAQASSQAAIVDIPIELTQDQLDTIRRNREKAEKLRQERLRKIQEKASVNLPEKNVIMEASTSTRRLSSETNGENQSDTALVDNVCVEVGSEENEPSTSHIEGNEATEGTKNDVHSDSDSEIQFSKKSYKRVIDNDEEEEITTCIEEKTSDNTDREDSNLPKNRDDIVEDPMEVDH